MLTRPRTLVAVAVAALIVRLALSDWVAAGTIATGGLCLTPLLRHRTRAAARQRTLSLVAGSIVLAVAAALLLPTYRTRIRPLVVTRDVAGPAPIADAASSASGNPFVALGFVASDYDDSAAGIERDARSLSTLAVTGITLASSPGSILVRPADDMLARAHLSGATGLALVSNFDGATFNGERAAATINSLPARRRFIEALRTEVTRRAWDGVVLDLEELPPSVRQSYPALVAELSRVLGRRETLVAIPALTDPAEAATGAFDLAALGRVADRVVWMAYDQHDPTSEPGPIAGLPWVRESVALAVSAIPPPKLLLGIPGYGYVWPGPGGAEVLTAPQAQAAAAAPGASKSWDEVQGEWRLHTLDNREAWFEDARSFGERARLAVDAGLGGITLWRVGAEDPAALTRLPSVPVKHSPSSRGRPVHPVDAKGIVALTFDDGPDPRWTRAVLGILHDKSVPGTFFVVGKEAQRYPSLLRQEMAEGHVVGNHTYSHLNLGNLPSWEARKEILGGAAVIEGITGKAPALLRVPYGAGDGRAHAAGGIDPLASALHQRVVYWTDDPDDWLRPGASVITQRVVDGASERTIVLLHDGGGDRSQTVAALPAIIDQLRARGFMFTTIDGLDASVPAPYAVHHGVGAGTRRLALLAGFRLQAALRRVGLELLSAVGALSILRLMVCVPLALAQARSARRRPVVDGAGTTVSIVVPCRNESRVIAKSLSAISRLEWEHVEVIVVDDGSTDGTAEVAGRFPCRVIPQQQLGKAAALNTGIGAASGEVVVVLDADTVLTPGFLRAAIPHFADPDVGAVAGNIKVGNRVSVLSRLQALEYLVSLNLDRRAQAQLNVMSVVPGAAGAFRRRALIDAGGYPGDTLVEDADLTVSLLRAGWLVPYEERAIALTEAPEHVRAAVRQRRRWSYGTIQVVAKHSDVILAPGAGRVGFIGLPWTLVSQVVLPAAGPLADLFLVLLALTGNRGLAAAIFGVSVTVECTVAAAAVIAEREDLRLLLWAPLLRVVWRPIQLVAIASSLRRWSHGEAERWRQIERYNTVAPPVFDRTATATVAGSRS